MNGMIAGIRTVYATDLERAQETGAAFTIGRHGEDRDDFGIGLFNIVTGENMLLRVRTQDMVELRDALLKELSDG